MTRRWIPAVVLLAALTASTASAQVSMSSGGGGGGAYALEEGEKNLRFAGIPIPGYSEVLGANLGLVVMAYYKMDRHDPDLPPSSTGVFGFYSGNNSWIGAAFQKFHLDGDKWRATAALGTGSVKYQFNPAGIDPGFPDIFIDYTQAMGFGYLDGSLRTWRDLYLGLAIITWSAQVTVEPDLGTGDDERYTGPGFTAEYDARDHIMFPTDGWAVDGRYLVFDDAFGSARDFQKLNVSASEYWAVGDSTRVIAARALYEGGYGDVPFSAQPIVSGNRNLRGYSNGRYRADMLATIEAEYRWNFHGKWGAAFFAGIGWSADKISEMALNDTLPGAGIGLRFQIIKTYRINARVDYAWGKDDQALYIAIGEHF